jgi:hypothetical protein
MTGPKAIRLLKGDLVRMLSETLGQEKAEEAISTAATRLGLAGAPDFDRAQTLAIFEHLAATPGIVGIVARFAKARSILAFRPPDEGPSSRPSNPDGPPSSVRSEPPKPLVWPDDPLDPKKR